MPNQTVPYGTVGDVPGTSCLATIILSLRDKSIRPSKCLTTIIALFGFHPLGTAFRLLRVLHFLRAMAFSCVLWENVFVLHHGSKHPRHELFGAETVRF
jgi:hypothetical protein